MRFPLALFVVLAFCGLNAKGQAHAQTAPTSSSPTLSVTAVNIQANSLAWDPVYQKIYLSLPSADGANGNAVQVLDPATGALGANAFAGSEPDLLAVSSTSKYLYVSLNGASTVQRLTLPNLGTDVLIALGNGGFSGPFFAYDLQASPASDETVAVVRGVTSESPAEEGGVVIYDNATARPNALCGFIQSGCTGSGGDLFDSIQWNANATTMYAANNEDTGFDFYSIPVTASGFGKVTDLGALVGGFGVSIHYDPATGYIYEDSGQIVNPAAGAVVGTFNASGLMVPDGPLGTAFFLVAGSTGVTVTSFDMQRFTPIATIAISNVVGSPTHFIRWGTNGLAFTTASNFLATTPGGAVYILSGSFVGVAPGVPPAIMSNGVVALDSSSNVVQPGEWISIYGADLARGTLSWNGNFPTSLGGTTVTVDGKPTYLSYVSPTQINLQVPNDTTVGSVPVVVTTSVGTATSTVTLAAFGPSIPLLDSKHVAAIILRSNGSGAYGNGTYDILGPTGMSLGYPTVAAKPGDSVALFAVGLGPTNPVVLAGQPYSGSAPTTNPVTLLINGVSVPTTFAGLSSAGLYQINFVVPAGLGTGDVALEVSVAGMATPSGAVISLQ
ncbi:MAG: IPT/TIG domain-containing protein [Bryobacteraceae bacterium]|jgi:uncharacterized protein (TIGR03437 family)